MGETINLNDSKNAFVLNRLLEAIHAYNPGIKASTRARVGNDCFRQAFWARVLG